jgi:hypothetical protein
MANVYLSSGENLPGLGPEGDFVTAYGLARLLAPPPRPAARRREIVILDG